MRGDLVWCDFCRVPHEVMEVFKGADFIVCPAAPPGVLYCFNTDYAHHGRGEE